MSEKPDTEQLNLSRRKAWRVKPVDRPGLGSILTDRINLKHFFHYWISNNLWNALHLIGHYSLKLLPMDTASAFGARLGQYAIPRFHKIAEVRARATIQRLSPHLTEPEQEALLQENQRSQGRIMTEFSVINRIADHPERLQYFGLEKIEEAARKGPVILAGMHLGNWEIGPIITRSIGLEVHTFYVPPTEGGKAWIAERVRRKNGVRLLPLGQQGMRPALKILQRGGVISTFCDEGFEGRIRGPFFDRKPHIEGNIALIVRLARLTGATICPWYNIRTDGFRFVAHALEPIILPPKSNTGNQLLEDMLMLNAAIEPVVRAHLDQWYFLDSGL